MKIVIGFALILLTGQHLAIAQGGGSAEKPQFQAVNFCDMMKHPHQYDGRTLQVSATYASNPESAVFFDNNCKKSESQPDAVASAKFTGSSEEVKRSLNQLGKALNKKSGAPHVARVTMIAVFRDNYSATNPSVCLDCPRYTLEVKRLLNVEKMPSEPTSRN